MLLDYVPPSSGRLWGVKVGRVGTANDRGTGSRVKPNARLDAGSPMKGARVRATWASYVIRLGLVHAGLTLGSLLVRAYQATDNRPAAHPQTRIASG